MGLRQMDLREEGLPLSLRLEVMVALGVVGGGAATDGAPLAIVWYWKLASEVEEGVFCCKC